jgi:hypothetical protein
MCKDGLTDECEGDDNRCWYKYDDESVKLIDDIESQMLSTQKAYILFYHKVEADASENKMKNQKGLIVTPVKQSCSKQIKVERQSLLKNQSSVFENASFGQNMVNRDNQFDEIMVNLDEPSEHQAIKRRSGKATE